MPRPSRNLDRALIAAGRELLPGRGCAGLSVREVAEHAGVNLGMFHYHFRSREAFLRAVLQDAYEEMFARLTLEVGRHEAAPMERLRSALRVLGRFMRDNRPFLGRVLADALAGEPCSHAFVRENLPRHTAVLRRLIEEAQEAGTLRRMPFPQALGVCAGAMVLPILAGGAIVDSGALAKRDARSLDAVLLSDAAIDQRIDLALLAIAQPMRTRKRAKVKA